MGDHAHRESRVSMIYFIFSPWLLRVRVVDAFSSNRKVNLCTCHASEHDIDRCVRQHGNYCTRTHWPTAGMRLRTCTRTCTRTNTQCNEPTCRNRTMNVMPMKLPSIKGPSSPCVHFQDFNTGYASANKMSATNCEICAHSVVHAIEQTHPQQHNTTLHRDGHKPFSRNTILRQTHTHLQQRNVLLPPHGVTQRRQREVAVHEHVDKRVGSH